MPDKHIENPIDRLTHFLAPSPHGNVSHLLLQTINTAHSYLNLCKELNIGDDYVIILSSDEEGNSYSPLMRFKDGMVNLGVEAEKKEVTPYPSSAHEIGW